MTRSAKRLAAARNNPKQVRPEDLDAILTEHGFTLEQSGTSHKVYRHSGLQVSVPQRTPHLLPVYVKKALKIIDELGLAEEDE